MKLDFTKRQIRRIEWSLFSLLENDDDRLRVEAILFDSNQIAKLEHLDVFCNLKHLSLSDNDLTEVRSIARLTHLEFVNLANNALTCLDGFKNLKHLKWLNISGNCIKTLDVLRFNIELEYVDASENEISTICDLSSLVDLVTLNLNRNYIATLRTIPKHLPKNIVNIFLAENIIDDLNEIGYLTVLDKLENLSIYNNSCLAYAPGYTLKNHEFLFDYRPFVINWCLDLINLDGSQVTQKEYLKAEWLFSQGKGRHFRPGQHVALVDYLTKTCPFNSAELLEEDLRLSKVLEKKVSYQSGDAAAKKTTTNGAAADHEHHVQSKASLPMPSTDLSYAAASFDHPRCVQDPQILSPRAVNRHNPAPPRVADFDDHQNSNEPVNQQQQLAAEKNFSNSSNESFEYYADGDQNEEYEDEEDDDERDLVGPHGGGESHRYLRNADSSLMDSDPNVNKSRYEDYDNRPIKPLDTHLFEKQISEYPEMSTEELEQLKKKINSFKRARSKTIENIKLPQQKSFNQPKRQVSMNMGSSRNGPLTGANGGESDERHSRFEPKKRSKTQEDLKAANRPINHNLKAAAVSTPKKQQPVSKAAPVINNGGGKTGLNKTPQQRYNPERYSPRLANVASRYMPVSSSPSSYLSRNNSLRKDTALPSAAKDIAAAAAVPKPSLLARLEQDESFMKNPLRRTTTISTTTSEDDEQSAAAKRKEKNKTAAATGTNLSKAPSFEKYVTKYSSGSSDSSSAAKLKPSSNGATAEVSSPKETLVDSGLIPPTEFQKLSMTEQLKQLKFHAKLKKQREEMMLTMQKKLEDFKKSKKTQQQQESNSKPPIENRSALRRTYDRDSNLTYGGDLDDEEHCAIKIQAAWRGYLVRRNLRELLRKHKLVKCRAIQSQVQTLKESLHDMLEDHREFCKVNFDTTQKILSALRNFSVNSSVLTSGGDTDFDSFMKAKIQPLDQNGAKQTELNGMKKDENRLLRENEELKSKLKALESRYHMLETKLETLTLTDSHSSQVSKMMSSSPQKPPPTAGEIVKDSLNSSSQQQQPRLEIYAPLRVRLQKLNEKSVALKWDHNPLNILVDLEGYHVYINEELCGVMKAKDQIASINGIQEEGEYRIHLRAFHGDVESAKSNEVITRVKKKNSKSASASNSNAASTSTTTFAHDTTSNLTNNGDESETVNESSRKSTTPRKKSSGLAKSADMAVTKPRAGDEEEKENDKTLDSLTPSTTHGDLRTSTTTTTSSSTTGSISGRPPKSQPAPASSQEPSTSGTVNHDPTAQAPLIRKHKQNVLTVADNLIKNLDRVCKQESDVQNLSDKNVTTPESLKPKQQHNESSSSTHSRSGSHGNGVLCSPRGGDHVISSDIFEFEKNLRKATKSSTDDDGNNSNQTSPAQKKSSEAAPQPVKYVSEGFDVSSSNAKQTEEAVLQDKEEPNVANNLVGISRHRPTKSHDLSARFFACAKPSESFASQLEGGENDDAPANISEMDDDASKMSDQTNTENTKYDDNFLQFAKRYADLIEEIEASNDANDAVPTQSRNMLISPRSNITSFMYSAKFSSSEPNLSAINLLRSQNTNASRTNTDSRDDSFVRKSLSFSEENVEDEEKPAMKLLEKAKLPLNDSEVVDPSQVINIIPPQQDGDDHIRI